jgi:hypothetical protein
MNLIDLYEMRDPRDAYQRDYDSSVNMGNRVGADVTGEEEPSGIFTVMVDGRPWKTGSSNEMFALASRVANKHSDKKIAVKWPTGELNTVRPQGVMEGPAVDAYMAGKSPALAHFADQLDKSIDEGSQRVDSLVTDALKIMQGATMNDAVAALKTVLGDREYNDRRGHYSFYVRQLMDMYGQQSMAEGAVDNLEARRIDDLNMKMLDLLDRAKEPAYKKNPAALAGLKKQFQKIKAERDSYFKINPATGMNDTGTLGTVKGALDEGQMKQEMHDAAERMTLAQFIDRYGDEDWIREFWNDVNGSIDEATGDNKFDAMMNRIGNDPWTQLNSDPNWQYEIEELVDQQIEPWLLTMERSSMPITRDGETLNPGWRKRYEQVSTQLAQKYLASKKFNPRDPDLVGKIRAAIDSHTDQSRNVHGQLSAYADDLPMHRYADAFDADGMTANIRDALAGFDPRDDDDDGYAPRPRPAADPRKLDPGNMEEAQDETVLDKYKERVGTLGNLQKDNERYQDWRDSYHAVATNSHRNRQRQDDADTDDKIERMAIDRDRLRQNDADWQDTFDMMRDRINRYQWSSQGSVDPKKLKKISNIKYQPTVREAGPAQAKTDDSLRAYWEKVKREKQSGVPSSVPTEKIPGKEDLLKGRGRDYYEATDDDKLDEKKLGQLRPTLGTARDVGRSVKKFRAQHGLDESGVAESAKPGEYYIHTVYFKDGTKKRVRVTSDEFDVADYYNKRGQAVDRVDYDFQLHSDMAEGLKSTLAGAALAGAMALGGAGAAQAQSTSSGPNPVNATTIIQQIQSGKIQNQNDLASALGNASNKQAVFKILQNKAGLPGHSADSVINALGKKGTTGAQQPTKSAVQSGSIVQRPTDNFEGRIKEDNDSDGHSVDHADSGEYDYEGDQAKDQLNTIVRAARRLNGLLDDNENMPEWVQMKITNAADYIDTAADYIESNQEPELAEGDKIGNMDADKFDAAMARLKQLAGAGPLKTVWDPAKRVYRNVPVAVQPKK